MSKKHTLIVFTLYFGALACVFHVASVKAVLAQEQKKQEQPIIAPADMPAMINELINKINKDIASTGEIFNRYFDNDFFKNAEEPFKEIEKQHMKIMNSMGREERDIFGKSWDKWYAGRFETPGIEIANSETADSVILKIRAPLAGERSLKVSVNNRSVNVDYDMVNKSETRDGKNTAYSSSLEMDHIFKILPVPDKAAAGSPKIESNGNEVTITFPKKR